MDGIPHIPPITPIARIISPVFGCKAALNSNKNVQDLITVYPKIKINRNVLTPNGKFTSSTGINPQPNTDPPVTPNKNKNLIGACIYKDSPKYINPWPPVTLIVRNQNKRTE
jgi:hypothetical protein